MIKYIGSKRLLVPWIVSVIQRVHEQTALTEVCDLFTGSTRVGHALKAAGFNVHANDLYTYSYVLARTLIGADECQYPCERIQPLLDELNALEGIEGYFTREFCVAANFFQPKNGRRIDAIRLRIDEMAGKDTTLACILLTSLMLAADRVDSTTGLQMAFLKSYAARSATELNLKYPAILPGPGKVTQEDAIELASSVTSDLVYIDPPYNQHAYLSNYHVWETLVLNDQPNAYGVARKREDCKSRKSPFNFKRAALPAMKALVEKLDVPHLLVSFSNEGFYTAADLEGVLESWGHVVRMSRPHPATSAPA